TPICGVAVHFQIATAVTPASKAARTPVTTHGSDRRPACAVGAAAGAPPRELPAATHFNCDSRSLALCQRSSGSLASARDTIWSSPAGVSGWMSDTGVGVDEMIDAISDAWLLPWNAFRPVSIS